VVMVTTELVGQTLARGLTEICPRPTGTTKSRDRDMEQVWKTTYPADLW
jgi:hypothetical protein